MNNEKKYPVLLDCTLRDGGYYNNWDFSTDLIENYLEKNSEFIEQENFTPKTPKVSPLDKKKYMEVLESFIFLKDQNKH